MINIKDVWKTYKMGDVAVHALRGLDLEVKEGEFLAIMGPSGSGKSTAMNMVGCLDIPTKGSIYLSKQDISTMTESRLAQIRGKKIGFIFQKFNLINTLTAKENITLPMMFQGITPEERLRKAEELLDMVGLADRKNHRPAELSGGQQQRVAIARSLANDPEVVLADEPTGNLDTKTGENVMTFLEKLHEEKGTTIVMVTHDEDVAKHADRVEHLRDGAIVKTRKNKHR
ncbi:ABC transporter ATP-binding protein [Candidatus Woesearchaeota archaeon]|nr:ABC transporter ATP-binding protein [Candidatus Woesearchaeota archaeon]